MPRTPSPNTRSLTSISARSTAVRRTLKRESRLPSAGTSVSHAVEGKPAGCSSRVRVYPAIVAAVCHDAWAMGILIPQNFPMESLVNDAERLVVSTLVDRLTDGWYVIPDVGILGSIDRQMDTCSRTNATASRSSR